MGVSFTRTGPTAERLALAAKVREMRDRPDPLTHRQIAVELGISRSYANTLDLDPDGSKTRVRKDGYGGTCVDCGARTDGSNGAPFAPERCASCSRAKQIAEKTWTRENVIDAIQRFAAEHGRPPVSTEWHRSDPDRGYPSIGSVFRSTSHPGAPFENWADAIEAAGFPRPAIGNRSWRTTMSDRNGYIVLRETDDGVWEIVGERTETSQVMALNAAMNGHPPEGRWLAVPIRYWRPRALKPRTIFDFVEETVEA